MKLPADPGMLYSMLNMKLRDEYPSLDELCVSEGVDKISLVKKLADFGFEYSPQTNQFH